MNSDLNLSKKCILYIDDNAASIEAALAIFEDDYNYSIISEISVEEGLETVNNYYGTIDAIILDLSFPDTKIQGKEGLIILKEKYGWIPVFILTGSTDSKENAIAQECLALGAEQVFHKDVFDVQVFMNQVTDAAHRENISQQLKSLKDYTSRAVESPYFHIVEHKTYVHGVFAFKLDAILTDLDNSVYTTWVKDFSQVLQYFPWVQVIQIYRNEKGKIGCYFKFLITAENAADALLKYRDFFFNISAFFNTTFVYQPTAFVPVTSLKLILELIVAGRTNSETEVFGFYRDQEIIEINNQKIGFKNKSHEIVSCGIPLPFDYNDEKLDILFHHLRAIPDLYLLHSFSAIQLDIEELDLIKKAQVSFTEESTLLYKENATRFLEHQLDLFTLKTVCIVPKKNIKSTLTLINNIFYNGTAPVDISEEDEERDYLEKYKRIQYLLTRKDLVKVVKIPLINEDHQTTFKTNRSSYQNIPTSALNKNNITLGEKNNKSVGLAPNQFQKHTYIIGKTGTGKTSVIKAMIQNRLESGDGLALIDPHGDIYEKIIQSIPENRKDDVILFDPTNPKNEFGFNILEYDKAFPEQKAFIVNELLKIFAELYDMKSAGGPMFEVYFKNAAYLVMEVYQKPLLEHIEKVFTSTSIRKELLTNCKNKRVTDFFAMAEATNGEQGFENFGPYITSKLTRFTDNELINKVISNTTTSFNFREMIDSKKIFLIKLNKGRLGDEGVNFIGRLLFNKMIMAAYTRENIPEEKRQDFTLFVDEFQNFTSSDIVSALGEARKYHLQLVLANQTFAQLDEKVAKNILGNVGSLITAAVSPYDAEMIAPFLEPEFTKQDIVQLDNYKFILNTQYNNKRVSPFIFNSIPY
ncbi:type IV secretory system conjugative DNA transfer protein [Psychroflexus torquis ATCC 700755]|uniref:Type IV secretory system conjugative DNA transfer protein n=1 Tax=Psychroflexus torquis (strain ATCC 700755 / CIP 106069 / ACAM 623) TaxID=313595 RepID=K4IER1_PSYTT|nr:type IV secretory system conjugative DNA transfer family protein [Psychroflexus torquis]AFU68909.1 type IV secretory system conjugative DNA transfer protein [Psychroflexus torquis ATCC 700755]